MPSASDYTTALHQTQNVSINPRLWQALEGFTASTSIPDTLQLSDLPSTYATAVHLMRDKIPLDYGENKHRLTCLECGHQGDYDIGMVALDIDRAVRRDPEVDQEAAFEAFIAKAQEAVQCTGYFRCDECNSAGKWSFDREFVVFLTSALNLLLMDYNSRTKYDLVQVGRLETFDGLAPKWASDTEEHLLTLIERRPADGFLWNRLGNTYLRGGVPELATVAFEKSIQCDEGQVESLVSLAHLLYNTEQLDACIRYSHLALAHARYYKYLKPEPLHRLLCVLLRNLLDACYAIDDTDSFLSPVELMESVAKQYRKPRSSDPSIYIDFFEFDLDDEMTFAGLAEIYLGKKVHTNKAGASRHHRKKKR